ncbi:hypothetical protein ACFSJU_14840 [Paradesertivirga mongoliensis]|uniref:Uncharacterized protein n=1 Tax=Paradesertivirga mongoliensis TaxID=2100740 RepID=A0ABW4ZNK6_9SPHI|nr:hypothetical protein [Pedobacter mongoliensis]
MKNLFDFFKCLLVVSLLATAFNPLIGIALFALFVALPKREMPGVFSADVSPDISKISTYIGKVAKGLQAKLFNSMDIAKDISLIPNVKNILVSTRLTVKNGPKPYTGVFNPVGDDLDYEPRTLTVEPFQRDLIVDPRKYRTSHFAYERGAGESSKNNKIPFEAFTIKTVLESDAAIFNNLTAFNGVGKAAFAAFNAGITYAVGAKIKFTLNNEMQYFVCKTATLAGESPSTHPAKWTESNALAICEGLGVKLIAGRAAAEITKVVSAAGKDAYPLFKELFRGHSDARKALGVNIYAPTSRVEELMDDFENKVGKYTENDGSGRMYLANTSKKGRIVPATWMKTGDPMFSGPIDNFQIGTDLLSDFNEVNVIPDVYTLKMGVAGVIGFNYQDAEEVVMTDEG